MCEARAGWCPVWCDGGDRVWPWAPRAFHMASFISQDTVRVPENQAKTIVTNGARGDGIYSGAFSEGFPNIAWGDLFSNLSPRPKHSVMSASLLKVSLSCFQQASQRITDSGFGLSLKEWSESRLYRKLSCASLHQGLNQINLCWVGAAFMDQQMPRILLQSSPQDQGTSSQRYEQCWR